MYGDWIKEKDWEHDHMGLGLHARWNMDVSKDKVSRNAHEMSSFSHRNCDLEVISNFSDMQTLNDET